MSQGLGVLPEYCFQNKAFSWKYKNKVSHGIRLKSTLHLCHYEEEIQNDGQADKWCIRRWTP